MYMRDQVPICVHNIVGLIYYESKGLYINMIHIILLLIYTLVYIYFFINFTILLRATEADDNMSTSNPST